MHKTEDLGTVSLSVPGRHNVSNSLAAIALCLNLGLPLDVIKKGLLQFGGTKRRFEYKGTKNGITVIDDYAHHPTEVAATLTAARNYPHGRIICVFQPHTYSRTKAFLSDFARVLSMADIVVLADIYAAREKKYDWDFFQKTFWQSFRKTVRKVIISRLLMRIEKFLSEKCINNDLLITMGAGDVYLIGEHLSPTVVIHIIHIVIHIFVNYGCGFFCLHNVFLKIAILSVLTAKLLPFQLP